MREFGVGSGAVRTIAGHDDAARGARGGARRVQGHARPSSRSSPASPPTPGVIPTITGETDLIVSRRAQPRLDHRRHAPLEGAAQGLPARGRRRRCARSSPRRASGGRDGTGEPYRLILVVTDGVFSHGRRHRAAARDRRGGRGVRRGGHGRRRPRVAASWAGTAAARSTTSGCTAGSRSRSARCRKAVGVARRLRRGLAGPARHPDPARPAVPLLDLAPAGRRRRLPRGDPGHGGGARAASSGCGRTPAGSRRSSTRLGFDTGRSETPITPVMMGDPETADPVLATGCSRRASSPSRSSSRPSPRPGPDPDDRDRRPRRRAARPGARRRSTGRPRAGRDRGMSRGAEGPSTELDRPAGARPAARRAPPHRPLARQRRRRSTPTPRLAVERGIAEIAITDHVDFDPRAPAYGYATFEDRERVVREAAERWAPPGSRSGSASS